VFITALPQSTTEVERTFSRLNNNKNKLRDCLAVCNWETIIRSSENFLGDFEVKTKTYSMHLYGKARKTYFEKFENSEAVGAITDETFHVNCNQLESCKGSGLCLRFIAKDAG